MQVRVINIQRNGKTYSYAQLVESYRRESDGMPMHRVVASLGAPDSVEVANLREALAASRVGRRVAPARGPSAPRAKTPKPTANLRYLDLAVLLELWNQAALDELVSSLIALGEAEVHAERVVCALVLQRCADPGSKLYASRWFPRTALPELLGVAPEAFNNTRLHRVLDALDQVGGALQGKLARSYLQGDGAFAALFLDVTDAWFVGQGPALAERGKTKEGVVKRKIGIVLLCNEHGFPVRWEVVPGNQFDGTAMSSMLDSIKGLSWAQRTPIVMDRAMGKTAQIAEMAASGLWFVTALTTPEFDGYSQQIPHQPFANLEPEGGEHLAQDLAEARARARAAAMVEVQDDLFVLDLGVVQRSESSGRSRNRQVAHTERTAEAMRCCRKINQAVADGQFSSLAAAGRALGLGKGLTKKYRLLGRLAEQIQRDVLDGKADACSIADLLRIAAMPDAQRQVEAFAQLLATRAQTPARRQHEPKARPTMHSDDGPHADETVRVRAVAYFNPERFVDQRLRTRSRLRSIEQFVQEINTRLRGLRSKLGRDGIIAAVDRKLRAYDLVEAFEVQITEHQDPERRFLQVAVHPDAEQWRKRQRYDGFTVLVTRPDMAHDPEQLCRLYRSKDAVEKDFQTIKSVTQLRPIRHHTDGKVRAHVSLCMLALLLERALEHKLGRSTTAEAALESLASCHLNRYATATSPSTYLVTQPDPEQQRLLRALRMQHLADDDEIADKIRHR